MRSRLATVILLTLAGGCGSPPGAPPDGGEDRPANLGDAAPDATSFDRAGDSPPQTQSCGGTVNATGTTPRGSFSATDIFLETVFPCRRVDVYVTDRGSGNLLGFSVLQSGTGAAATLVGAQSGIATVSPIAGGTLMLTTVDVNVTSADNPFAMGASDAQPMGRMEASFTLAQNGFSITGSFSSAYCSARMCQQ